MKCITTITVLVLLSACAEPVSDAEDYLTRLENVLDRETDASSITRIEASFPDPKELEVRAPTFELSIREFLGMRACRLHTVVAQRNSQLGKVATDSQRLFNDLEILSLGPACIKTLGESTLAKKLSRFLEKKEAHLNTATWEALLASKEHRSFWHDKRFSDEYPGDLTRKLDRKLKVLSEFVVAIQSGQRRFTKQQQDEVERALGQLRLGDGGHLYSEFAKLASSLEQADSLILKRLNTPLCRQQQNTQQARYFSNVVNQYFIAKVQAYAVKLEQRAQTLMPLINDIEKPLLPFATADYKNWAQARDTHFRKSRAAALKHAKLIQELYQQCALSPGVPKK